MSFFTSPASYLTPTTNSLLPSAAASASKGMIIDPFTAVLSIGSIANSIFSGKSQADAAKEQADAARQAAEEARIASEKAAITGATARLAGDIAGFGFDFKSKLADTGLFAARERSKALEDAAQSANFQAFNPAAMATRRVDEYNQRLRNAFGKSPGYVPTAGLFV